MKRYVTLAVLAAALVVGAALAVWDRHRPSTDEAAKAAGRILPDLTPARAGTLEILRRDERRYQLVREPGGWWLLSPRQRANDDAVESLLAVLELGRIERRVGQVDAKTLASFGLSPPLVTLRVAGTSLRIGGDGPGRGVYVQRGESPEVLVAEHRLVETADLDPALWTSPRLTVDDPAAARQVSFGGWTLTRDRGWRVTAPVIARASDGRVDALLQSLARVRAARRLELPSLPASVTLAFDGHEEARLDGACPGAPGQTLVSRADGPMLCFATAELDTLRAPVTTLYERRLFPMRLDEVNAVDVESAGRALSVRRENGAWRVVAPRSDAGPADDGKVRAFIQPLVEADARDFTAAPPSGQRARVRLAGGGEDVTVELGVAGGVGLARRAGETLSLEVAADLVAPLTTVDAARLRSADAAIKPAGSAR